MRWYIQNSIWIAKRDEAAKNMLNKKYPIDDIAEITGLFIEQIKEIITKTAVTATN